MKLKQLSKGFRNQLGVIDALLFRELLTKKSFSYLGFIGVIIEPLIITFIYLIILNLIRINVDIGLNTILFFGTGILIFSFFISIFSRSLNAIKANRNLFYYKRVKPIDTVIARTFIEIILLAIVYTIILALVFYVNNKIILDNLPILLLVFILVTLLSFSVGLIGMVIGNRFENITNWIPVLSRPLFFTSGCLYSINAIPNDFRIFILWNPLLHAIELARNSLDNNYRLDEQISLNYLFSITLIFFGFSIFIYQKTEKYLIKKI
tara:strand:+ start:150 stop:944 length:795 start_codon:yes stop_codon:yes gene_type:complete